MTNEATIADRQNITPAIRAEAARLRRAAVLGNRDALMQATVEAANRINARAKAKASLRPMPNAVVPAPVIDMRVAYNITVAAKSLSISVPTLRRLLRLGVAKGHRIGKRIVFTREDLLDLVNSNPAGRNVG